MFGHVTSGAVYAYAYEEVVIDDQVTRLSKRFFNLDKSERDMPITEFADVRFYGGAVRVLMTGQAPRSDYGIPFGDLDREVFTVGEAMRLRMIRQGDEDGLVRVTYYTLGRGQ